ncbi:hypothetical protein A2U01_0023428, partial [Trifolium medium]|nr:hypothetical protein [Trifolium medium]
GGEGSAKVLPTQSRPVDIPSNNVKRKHTRTVQFILVIYLILI